MVAAKDLVLAGVKALTLCDPEKVTLRDLSSQFFLAEADIGKSRGEASLSKLAELNQCVATCACPRV